MVQQQQQQQQQQQATLTQPSYPYQQLPDNSELNSFDFAQSFNPDQTYTDPSFAASNNDYPYLQNVPQAPTHGSSLAPIATPSTDLVRRSRNQQLAVPQVQQQEQWKGGAGDMEGSVQEEDEQELDMKVQLAKRDAQGKRKQIPPFVQKLSR